MVHSLGLLSVEVFVAGAHPIPPGSFHIIAPQLPSVGRNWRSERALWEIARGIGDVSLGRFPSHYRRFDAPPLSTGAALHARSRTEVVRASRPISPPE